MTEPLFSRTLDTPTGALRLVASEAALLAVTFVRPRHAPPYPDAVEEEAASRGAAGRVLEQASAELLEYFAGRRTAFAVAIEPRGPAFHQAVWERLLAIPFGETRSYGAIAAALDRPGAARAVGAANGQNPLGIIVPCHRVVGANGSLTGYAGGLERKRWLLDHEQRLSAPAFRLTAQ